LGNASIARRLPSGIASLAIAAGMINAVAAATSSQSRAPKLIWSDEFTGPAGPVNRARWRYDLGAGGWGDAELQTYAAANASLDGHGHLVIVARRGTGPGGGFTSARLTTAGRFSFRYGRVEARIKVPAGPGLQAAFWALGSDYRTVGWPGSGEIDVMEVLGQRPRTVIATVHGPSSHSSHGYAIGHAATASRPLSDAFHVYGMVWGPGSIVWTLDGRPYARVTRSMLPATGSWVFDHRFSLLLSLAVGGTWPGPPTSPTTFPARLIVDWVRVYR
jgi:beta-glucanase (GH16 family)